MRRSALPGLSHGDEHAAWLASFPEQDPDPIVELDLQGRVTYLNPACRRLFPNLTVAGLKDPWLVRLEGVLAQFRRGATAPVQREVELAGVWFLQSVYFEPALQRARVHGVDITERKQAREILREQAVLLEHAHVMIQDAGGHIVMWNKGAEGLYGFTREQALGQPSHALLQTRLPVSYQEYQAELFEKGEWQGNVVQTKRDGSQVVVASHQYLHRDAKGNPFRILEVNNDITELKRAQEQLGAAAKLRADMISLINHEYANALNNMRLALTLLQSGQPQAPASTGAQAFGVLERSIESLRASTSNFLNLHRLESGRFELDLRPTDLRPLIGDVLSLLRPMVDAKQQRLELQTELAEGEPVVVRADGEALSLVMRNLVTNAVKYTPKEGAIAVRLGRGPEGRVLVAVEDTGIGVSAEDLERILSGYYRTEASRKVAKGFGVGLQLVQELLDKHGSRLEVRSEPGKGSRFSFTLPLLPEVK